MPRHYVNFEIGHVLRLERALFTFVPLGARLIRMIQIDVFLQVRLRFALVRALRTFMPLFLLLFRVACFHVSRQIRLVFNFVWTLGALEPRDVFSVQMSRVYVAF
mgnify:CR=1 FL=1